MDQASLEVKALPCTLDSVWCLGKSEGPRQRGKDQSAGEERRMVPND
jgi:hypothetical protein